MYNTLHERRKQLGYTLTQLASQVGVTPSFLSLVERGLRVPRLETAQKLANVLDCTIDELFPAPVGSSHRC